MIHLKFTASIVKLDKGSYVAHAAEFPLTAEPASTQRGAIKNLRVALLRYLRKATEEANLQNVLLEEGYNPDLLSFPGATMRPFVGDTADTFVTMPHRRVHLPAGYRRKGRHALR
jgi:hypothetical protein